MKKRSISVAAILILIMAFATVAVAQNPFVGTWKLNLDKSSFVGPAPLEWIDTYREIEGDQCEVTTKIVLPDGSKMDEVIVWPRQGGASTFVKGGSEGTNEVASMISQNEMIGTRMVDGKQIGLLKIIASQDGKTLRYTIKIPGTMEGEAVFDKQ